MSIGATFFNNDDYSTEHDYQRYDYHCINEHLHATLKIVIVFLVLLVELILIKF